MSISYPFVKCYKEVIVILTNVKVPINTDVFMTTSTPVSSLSTEFKT